MPTVSTNSSSAVRRLSSPAAPARRSTRRRSSDAADSVYARHQVVAEQEWLKALPLTPLRFSAEGAIHGPLPQARNGRERDQSRRRQSARRRWRAFSPTSRRAATRRCASCRRNSTTGRRPSFRLTPAEIERADSAGVAKRDLDDIKFAQQQVRNFAQKQKEPCTTSRSRPCRGSCSATAHPGRTRSAATCRAGAIPWSPPPTCRS